MAEPPHDPSPDPAADPTADDRRFLDCVGRYLDAADGADDTLSADDLVWLNGQLADRADRREQFVRLCTVRSVLAEEFNAAAGLDAPPLDDGDGADDWQPVAPPTPARQWAARRARRVPPAYASWRPALAAAVLLAAGLAWLNRPTHTPQRQAGVGGTPAVVATKIASATTAATPAADPVATVVAVRDGVFDGPPWAVGGRLAAGTALSLARGCVELKFADGTTAVLEGPARGTLASATAVTLDRGRLAADVSGGRFVVTTPRTVVTDLGTAFGVNVQDDGQARVEVFKGSVRVEGKTPGSAAPVVLGVGEAAVGVVRDERGAVPQHFVHELKAPPEPPAMADVVDLLAGGDGLGRRRGQGVHAVNGRVATTQVGPFVSPHGYQRVKTLPAVDGVFVPDGSGTPTVLDSAGHTAVLPPTDGRSYALIWAGGPVPALVPTPTGTTPRTGATLGGINYAADGHGLIAADSNKGVTFDLDALRRLHPRHEPTRFRSGVGNTFPGVLNKSANPPKADVRVFVDGRIVFERDGVVHADGAVGVDVAIGQADRFLTLVVTDGGDGTGYDWVIWADPLIDLSPARP